MFTLVVCLLAHTARGQRDTIYRLPDALVLGQRHTELGDATKMVVRADSLKGTEAMAPLAQLLSRRGGMYLRIYSPSGLAALPLRGLSPAHTAVVWNDMPIVNPMNGVPDLSLIPSGLMQEATLVEGGAAALYGSGAMAGQLELQSSLPRRQGWQGRLWTGWGSYGEQRLLARAGFRRKELAAGLGLAHRLERNEYPLPFTNAIQQWARAEVLDLTLDAEAPFGKKGRLQLFGWWQTADRQIPPSLTSALTHDVQQDHSLKAALRWTRPSAGGLWRAMLGWQRDDILFFSDLVDSSFSLAHRHYARLERLWQAGAWQFRLGAEGQYLRGRADGYAGRPRRTQADLLAFAKKETARGASLALHGRLQWIAGEALVPSGSVVWSWHWRDIALRLALARNFRMPTFNDRYWFDGMARGNADLKPEKGWNAEWGLSGSFWLDWHLNLHAARVNDWILWTPQDGIWQPHNVQTVWSRGLTLRLQKKVPLWKGRLAAAADWKYQRATVQRRYDGSSDVVGESLAYVPRWTASLFGKWEKGAWWASLLVRTNSPELISPLGALVPSLFDATFVDAGAGRSFHLPKGKLQLALEVTDLFDNRVEFLSFRPLPGRALHLSLGYGF